jgi:hypothetical protein
MAATVLRWIETLLLGAIGVFMLALPNSEIYWRFLNPKYSWLTLIAGALVTFLALCNAFDRRWPKISELLGLMAFLFLAGAAAALPNPYYDAGPSSSATFGSAEADLPLMTESRLTLDGEEYVKINLAELLIKEKNNVLQAGDRYAFQGSVTRTPELDGAGFVAVSRLLIACCFADAVGVSYFVRVNNPGEFETGQWVRASGVLVPDNLDMNKTAISMQGAISTLTSKSFVLDSVQASIAPSDIPFIFVVRDSEPYAY